MKDFTKSLVLLSLCVACLGACTVYKTHFKDQDSADDWVEYDSTLVMAPFSKLNGQDAAMHYHSKSKEEWQIDVGQKLDELDQTPQVEALKQAALIVDSALKAYAAIQGVPVGAIPSLPTLPNGVSIPGLTATPKAKATP